MQDGSSLQIVHSYYCTETNILVIHPFIYISYIIQRKCFCHYLDFAFGNVIQCFVLLSKCEKAYLSGDKEQFTKPQQRYIRCRLRKKLRLLNEEFRLAGIIPESCNSVAESCNGLNISKPLSQLVAPCNFHAPWPGGEQCE